MENLVNFYRGRKVFVTGHTGFKGTWLVSVLLGLGAEVSGYALAPQECDALYTAAGLERQLGVHSTIADVRDAEALLRALDRSEAEIVIHLAAQPIVREGYERPAYTYETNVMGTVNLLEAARHCPGVRSILNVTTDKVYRNNEWERGYREGDELDGYDPYSNSKSCSELVTATYRRSFFEARGVAVSTARAGNVIGGGDFARDRLIPDCVRAAIAGKNVRLRNPHSVRPFQHVLEPVYAYLLIAMRQYETPELASSYNVGPEYEDCVTAGRLAELFCSEWGGGLRCETVSDGGPHEAGLLRLDCAHIKETLGWRPVWNIERAVSETVRWTKVWQNGGDCAAEMRRESEEYLRCLKI